MPIGSTRLLGFWVFAILLLVERGTSCIRCLKATTLGLQMEDKDVIY